MIRTALWLLSEVGVGCSFTKEQHRAAFPGVAQADRRLRDLRDWGWVISTNAEDATLNPEEQRFVAAGIPVWEHGSRKPTKTVPLTAKVRMTTLAENDYQCITCGISGGESYPDAPHTRAILGVSRKTVNSSEGKEQTMFVPECKRCRSGGGGGALNVPLLLDSIRALNQADKAILVQWFERGRRSTLDRLWAQFRQLPTPARNQLLEDLKRE
jgi:hypothetical protein